LKGLGRGDGGEGDLRASWQFRVFFTLKQMHNRFVDVYFFTLHNRENAKKLKHKNPIAHQLEFMAARW
jgi:hypothetical protein